MANLDRYTIVKNIAKGSFGDILLALQQDKQEVVIKRIPKSKVNERIHKEVEALERLNDNAGVSRLHTHFSDEDNHYLVMDFIEGGDLFAYLERASFLALPEKVTRKIMKQLVKTLTYAHQHGVVHRDLKLENILINKKKKVTLVDFGLCEITDAAHNDFVGAGSNNNKTCTDWSGSLEYVAPEVLLRVPHDPYKAEVYSLGITLYALAFAQFPFSNETRLHAIHNRLRHPEPNFPSNPINSNVSADLIDLLRKMLKSDPSERISMGQVASHKWLKKNPFF